MWPGCKNWQHSWSMCLRVTTSILSILKCLRTLRKAFHLPIGQGWWQQKLHLILTTFFESWIFTMIKTAGAPSMQAQMLLCGQLLVAVEHIGISCML